MSTLVDSTDILVLWSETRICNCWCKSTYRRCTSRWSRSRSTCSLSCPYQFASLHENCCFELRRLAEKVVSDNLTEFQGRGMAILQFRLKGKDSNDTSYTIKYLENVGIFPIAYPHQTIKFGGKLSRTISNGNACLYPLDLCTLLSPPVNTLDEASKLFCFIGSSGTLPHPR